MGQTRLDHSQGRPAYSDDVCARCMGHRHLCGIAPCPLLMRARALADIGRAVRGLSLEGASPPAVFVGSSGYPRVLAGPLVPPVKTPAAAEMERPDLWIDRTIDEIMRLRFSLVRTKQALPVIAARDPPRELAEAQTMTLSESPVEAEAQLLRRPTFTTVITRGLLPVGPSAPLERFHLEDNPRVPRPVDRVTSDTDLGAGAGVVRLFEEGIRQEHIVRLFSVGLLGEGKRRRLVPTEWSITAVDDIVGRQLHRRVVRMPWLNDYMVASHRALGNTVVLLFVPSEWQFEVLEHWLGPHSRTVPSDHEGVRGRKTYARRIEGAYYAVRLPVLEFLTRAGRQGGVIAFLEVNPTEWVPLGVWRFREIARRALAVGPVKYTSLEEALGAVGRHLRLPLEHWLRASYVYGEHSVQTRLTDF